MKRTGLAISWTIILCILGAAQAPDVKYDPAIAQISIKFPKRKLSGTPVVQLGAVMLRRGLESYGTPRTVAGSLQSCQASEPDDSTCLTLNVPQDLLRPRTPFAFEVRVDGLRDETTSPAAAVGQLRLMVPNTLKLVVDFSKPLPGNKVLTVRIDNSSLSPADWSNIQSWLKYFESHPDKVKFYYVNKSSREGETVPVAVKEFKVGSLIASQGRLQSTLTLDKPLPPAIKTDLALSFKDEEFFQSHPTIPPYEELRGEVRTSIEATPASNLKTTEAAERTFANNLELGAAFTSTVETEKDKVTGINKRFRQNVGVLDLQLAPFFTYRTFGEARERANGEVYIPWELITTPLKIDAIVSTGSELKRLALNRIELATEVEFRKLAGLSIGSNIYHLVGRFGQVSDRDFKDFEHGGSFDFRINPGFIEKLLYSEPRAVLPRFDFTVVGVDLALATTRKSEFELAELMRPLDKRRFVRRLRFGGTFELNVSKFLFMKVQDMLYLRGGDEFAMDRGKHYFKAELELPLLSEFTNQGFAQSFAVAATYERGTKPPFTTPDVNAFRIGFRYRSNWSFFR